MEKTKKIAKILYKRRKIELENSFFNINIISKSTH